MVGARKDGGWEGGSKRRVGGMWKTRGRREVGEGREREGGNEGGRE